MMPFSLGGKTIFLRPSIHSLNLLKPMGLLEPILLLLGVGGIQPKLSVSYVHTGLCNVRTSDHFP